MDVGNARVDGKVAVCVPAMGGVRMPADEHLFLAREQDPDAFLKPPRQWRQSLLLSPKYVPAVAVLYNIDVRSGLAIGGF